MHTVSILSEEIVQRAQKAPVSEDKIRTQLSKLNDSIYIMDTFEKSGDDDIFMSLKTLNQMRRDAVEALNEARLVFTRTKQNYPESSFSDIHPVSGLMYEIHHDDQKEALDVSDCVFSANIKADGIHTKGYRVDENSSILSGDIVMHTQIGSLNQVKDNQIWLADASLNVTNSYAIEFLMQQGIDGCVASLEADDNAIEAMCNAFEQRHGFMPQIGKVVYGRRELMIMKACLINAALGNGLKTNCALCKTNQYALVSEKGLVYPMSQDGQCHPIVYESELLKDTVKNDKISYSIVRFTNETAKECKEIKKVYEKFFR